jgi:hypothetical protein
MWGWDGRGQAEQPEIEMTKVIEAVPELKTVE